MALGCDGASPPGLLGVTVLGRGSTQVVEGGRGVGVGEVERKSTIGSWLTKSLCGEVADIATAKPRGGSGVCDEGTTGTYPRVREEELRRGGDERGKKMVALLFLIFRFRFDALSKFTVR